MTLRLPADEADMVLPSGTPLGFASSGAKLMLECRREEVSLAFEARGAESWLPPASGGGKYSRDCCGGAVDDGETSESEAWGVLRDGTETCAVLSIL